MKQATKRNHQVEHLSKGKKKPFEVVKVKDTCLCSECVMFDVAKFFHHSTKEKVFFGKKMHLFTVLSFGRS